MDEMQGSIIKALSKFLFGAGLKRALKNDFATSIFWNQTSAGASMRGAKNTNSASGQTAKQRREAEKRLKATMTSRLVIDTTYSMAWRARWEGKIEKKDETTWNNLSFVRQITALSLMVMSKWAGGSDGYLCSHSKIGNFHKQIFTKRRRRRRCRLAKYPLGWSMTLLA